MMSAEAGIVRLDIYRIIGELAYVVAKADHGLSVQEKEAFYKIAREELHYDSWAAKARFQYLDEVQKPAIDTAYNDALQELRKYRDHLSDEIKDKAMVVMQRVAASCEGLSAKETFNLDRFRKDLQRLD